MFHRELLECAFVQVDLRRLAGLGQALGLAREAEGAVTAWFRAGLPEVGDERLHLAAVMGDERNDARDPVGFRLLAPLEPRSQRVPDLVE